MPTYNIVSYTAAELAHADELEHTQVAMLDDDDMAEQYDLQVSSSVYVIPRPFY